MRLSTLRRRVLGGSLAGATALALALVTPLTAQAAPPYASDTPPDIIGPLSGYDAYWQPSADPTHPFAGTPLDAAILSRNDLLATWINNHATTYSTLGTGSQQFRALQDAQYRDAQGGGYDQSLTVSEGLGDVLSAYYVQGISNGSLPLVQSLINSSTGTTGAYVRTGGAKTRFSYPRPYITGDPSTQNYPASSSNDPAVNCPPARYNTTTLGAIRAGQAYATNGQLNIRYVPDTVDSTHEFASSDVSMSAGYSAAGICTGGSYPSGHTTTAYEAGITLATLLPEFAPEVLARASEAGNNRIVLGVHFPLDVVGGRIDGEVGLAARWSDARFRTEQLEPARQQLVSYLLARCAPATTLTACAATGSAYRDDPYGGQAMPGGTSQVVTDRSSALAVYTERLTYGFPASGVTGLPASVPDGASNLLLTTFPTLTDAQRTAVLAQTELSSGYPLDRTAAGAPAWQRLNLAAAMSATVQSNADGSVTVVSTGGAAQVLAAPSPTTPTAPAPTTPGVRLPVVSG